MNKPQAARILVVDDDDQILLVWRGALLRFGTQLRLETAQDGCQALDLVLRNAFDLIVTDIRLPCMGGCELTEAIRQRDHDVPVIWITGYPEQGLEQRAADLGVSQLLAKPLSIDRIRQLVSEYTLQDNELGVLPRRHA